MVNTMVKDPQRRKLNRQLDRQKKARMKLNTKTLLNPSDAPSETLVQMHTRRITELKKERNKLNVEQAETETKKSS